MRMAINVSNVAWLLVDVVMHRLKKGRNLIECTLPFGLE